MLRKTTLALLLVLVLLLVLGCVNPEETTNPTDSLPSDSTGTEDVQTPPDHTDEGGIDNQNPTDEGLILPDNEQFDTGGFPNPPEDDATKRY